MLKKILLALITLVAILGIAGFFLPDDAHVERSVAIEAPICTVHSLINDFSRFNEWSPWADIDPDAEYSFEGPSSGVGAKMSWVSDDRNVGTGSQEITASEDYNLVESHLDFGSQGTAEAFFKLTEEDDATHVVWGFDTSFEGNIIGRYFGLMIDSMVGNDFEKGLGRLKPLAEGLPKTDWCDLQVQTVTKESATMAYVAGRSALDTDAVGAALAEAYGQVGAFMGKHGLQPVGPPITVNESYDAEGYSFLAGMPVAGAALASLEVAEDSPVQLRETWTGEALQVIHTGPYESLEGTYEKIEALLAVRSLQAAGPTWDEYVTDPASTPADQLVTHVYVPLS